MVHFRDEVFLANYVRLRIWTALALLAISAGTILAQTTGTRVLLGPPLPEGVGKDITHKVCGATCHGTDVIVGKGRTRDQWTAVVNAMVARGAKASDTEFVQITEYLSSHFGPNSVVPFASTRGNRPAADAPRAAGRGPGPLGSGAADSHVVDDAGAERGKSIYIAECITMESRRAEAIPACRGISRARI